jgi:hypothetical protein
MMYTLSVNGRGGCQLQRHPQLTLSEDGMNVG